MTKHAVLRTFGVLCGPLYYCSAKKADSVKHGGMHISVMAKPSPIFFSFFESAAAAMARMLQLILSAKVHL